MEKQGSPETVESSPSSTLQSAKVNEAQLTRTILWKLDCRILPCIALIWLANFIDRSNIGNARIAGLERDAHLRGHEFNSALAIFYVSYILVELPSNWLLKRLRPNRWLPAIVCLWGMVTVMTCFVHNFAGLLAIRFFLGACEGGLLGGIVLYLSTIYRRHELQLRVGIFYASAGISGAFGGLLASAIIKMDGIGGLAGWKWIFVLEGIATVFAGLVAAWFLPESLAKAKFFSQEERNFALRRFWADTGLEVPTDTEKHAVIIPDDEQFELREVIRGLTDIQTWITAVAYFGIIVSLYSYSLFLPTIVAGLGYTGPAAQLHTVPPYVPASFLTVVVAFLSDRLKWRGPFIMMLLVIAITGYIVVITAKSNNARYGGFFLIASGIYPCGPCILSILPNNTSGYYKRATTTALQLGLANIGAFVATFTYTPDDAQNNYKRGHTIALCFLCVSWLAITTNVLYCLRENAARRDGKRQYLLTQYEELRRKGLTSAPIGDRDPQFRFTL